MKTLFFKYFIFVSASYGMLGCCSNEIIKCGNGDSVAIPNSEVCAKTYYEDAVSSLDLSTKATIDVVEQVKVEGSTELRRDIILLADKLDQESIRFKESVKASYLALRANPCGNADRHYKLLQALNDKSYDLLRLKVKLENDSSVAQNEEVVRGFLYERGREDGRNMGILNRTIESYYERNNKFPYSFDDLNINDIINNLAESRLEYNVVNDNEVTIRFAGEDYALNTSDDKIYRGSNGSIVAVEN
ncbi:MAG: hypothetical protein R6W90_08330 [Ignavibacteriaceae bacterium]